MSDLFHKRIPKEFVSSVFNTMEKANWHTYQVLTKRSARLRDSLNTYLRQAAVASHVWWGVSVEDRKYGIPRITHLQQSARSAAQ